MLFYVCYFRALESQASLLKNSFIKTAYNHIINTHTQWELRVSCYQYLILILTTSRTKIIKSPTFSLGLNRCQTLPAVSSQLAVQGLSSKAQKCQGIFLNILFSAALRAISAGFIAYHCKVKVFVFPLISLQQSINSLGQERLRTLVKEKPCNLQ